MQWPKVYSLIVQKFEEEIEKEEPEVGFGIVNDNIYEDFNEETMIAKEMTEDDITIKKDDINKKTIDLIDRIREELDKNTSIADGKKII